MNVSTTSRKSPPKEDDFAQVEHTHWRGEVKVADILLLIMLSIAPTGIYLALLFVTNDFLISQTGYLFALSVLSYLFIHLRKGTHLDVLFIPEVSRPKYQIKIGIILALFAAALSPIAVSVIKSAGFNILTNGYFLMPFGIELKSKFPKIMHAFYLLFYGISFGLLGPLFEVRYYFVFLRKKIDNTFFTIFLFSVLIFGHSLFIIEQFVEGSAIVGSILIGAVLLHYAILSVVMKSRGAISSILYLIGVNVGVVITIGLLFYSNKMTAPNGLLETMFSSRNIWEIIASGVIEKVTVTQSKG